MEVGKFWHFGVFAIAEFPSLTCPPPARLDFCKPAEGPPADAICSLLCPVCSGVLNSNSRCFSGARGGLETLGLPRLTLQGCCSATCCNEDCEPCSIPGPCPGKGHETIPMQHVTKLDQCWGTYGNLLRISLYQSSRCKPKMAYSLHNGPSAPSLPHNV